MPVIIYNYMTTQEKGDIIDQLVAWGCGILHLQKYTKTFQQLAKFFIVGCTNTAINWVIFAIALAALPIPDEVFRTVVSSAIAFAISTIFNFWASTTWVFDTTTEKTRRRLFIEFAAFNGIAFLIFDEALLAFLVALDWIPMVAKVLTTACGMVFNFFTRKMFLEGKKPHFGKKKFSKTPGLDQTSKTAKSPKSPKASKSQPKLGCFLLVAFLSGSFILSSAQPVFAELSAGQMNFYNENGILYYDPQGGDDCVIVVGSANGNINPGDADSSIASPGLSAVQAAFVDQYHDIAESLSIAYGIPWETVMAQGILESDAGTSNFAVERNNFFGIGAFDSNPDNAYSYANPTEGWNGYYHNISVTETYRAHGVFQGATVTDPYAYLAAIKSAGYATDPDYIAKVSGFIAAIEERSALQGWKSSAELAAEHPEWAENAAANAAGGGGASGNLSTSFDAMSSYTQCINGVSGGAGAGNGDLNSTAIALAYGMGDIHLEPSAAYRAAVNAVLTDAMANFDEIGLYADCGHFVATILRYSGVDPNVPYGPTSTQMAYYLSHPELYEEVPNLGNTSNLQPGDIRVSGGHTDMVVRDSSGNLILASASLRERSGNLENYYPNPEMRIFRHK